MLILQLWNKGKQIYYWQIDNFSFMNRLELALRLIATGKVAINVSGRVIEYKDSKEVKKDAAPHP